MSIKRVKATELLHNLGQSLWLDNITRDLLYTGTLQRYIDELSVTGLTANGTNTVDGQFGAAILQDAKAQGYITACPAEKAAGRIRLRVR